MDYEINQIKYLALIGKVQSGKTREEINYCIESVNKYNLPVIFILRNIKADQIQLQSRIKETNLNVKNLNDLTINFAAELMESVGVLVLLCNHHQLLKMKKVLSVYHGLTISMEPPERLYVLTRPPQ